MIAVTSGDVWTWAVVRRIDSSVGLLWFGQPGEAETHLDPSPEAEVVRVAVQSGIVFEWAGVTKYDRSAGQAYLARYDTDGKPMRVYPRDIRKALTRAERNGDLTAGEIAEVAAGDVHPHTADTLVQLAVIGRVLYVDEPGGLR